MGFDLDPCLVRASTGELLARGFVREDAAGGLVIEASQLTGGWLHPGDTAVLEVMSAHRGACTYDTIVGSSVGHRIELVRLTLRQAVQQRAAVRIPVALPVVLTHQVEDGDLIPLDRPVEVVVIDVSGHGLRFRAASPFEPGERLAMTLTATRSPLELELEVLRREPLRGELAYGCRIVGLTERQMDELFHYVLDEQRRQLARRADNR